MKPRKATAADILNYYRLAEAPETARIRLTQADARASSCQKERGGRKSAEWRRYAGNEAKYCFENRKDVAKIYENPLDDDEKLREVRLMLFGSAPE